MIYLSRDTVVFVESSGLLPLLRVLRGVFTARTPIFGIVYAALPLAFLANCAHHWPLLTRKNDIYRGWE